MFEKYIEIIGDVIKSGDDEFLSQVCMAIGAGSMLVGIYGADPNEIVNAFDTESPMETYDICIGKIKELYMAMSESSERDEKKAAFHVVK